MIVSHRSWLIPYSLVTALTICFMCSLSFKSSHVTVKFDLGVVFWGPSFEIDEKRWGSSSFMSVNWRLSSSFWDRCCFKLGLRICSSSRYYLNKFLVLLELVAIELRIWFIFWLRLAGLVESRLSNDCREIPLCPSSISFSDEPFEEPSSASSIGERPATSLGLELFLKSSI